MPDEVRRVARVAREVFYDALEEDNISFTRAHFAAQSSRILLGAKGNK